VPEEIRTAGFLVETRAFFLEAESAVAKDESN
jgi:hypothetical protein